MKGNPVYNRENVMLTQSQVSDIFKALSDPNRLQVYKLLLTSDRTNSELMEATGLRQNLLSHHLNILTESGLVRAHRSIGDARRHYYSVDLAVARQFDEWWQQHSPCLSANSSLPALQRPRKVLFFCLRNTSRSLMAEALARAIASQAIIPYSAGMKEPGPPLPLCTLQVLAENGVSVEGVYAKSYHELGDVSFDYVITVCDIVHESGSPGALVPEGTPILHWSLHDPLEVADNEDDQLLAARELFDEIRLRLTYFVQRLVTEETRQS